MYSYIEVCGVVCEGGKSYAPGASDDTLSDPTVRVAWGQFELRSIQNIFDGSAICKVIKN